MLNPYRSPESSQSGGPERTARFRFVLGVLALFGASSPLAVRIAFFLQNDPVMGNNIMLALLSALALLWIMGLVINFAGMLRASAVSIVGLILNALSVLAWMVASG